VRTILVTGPHREAVLSAVAKHFARPREVIAVIAAKKIPSGLHAECIVHADDRKSVTITKGQRRGFLWLE
jgi:hypothetical protein